MRRSPINPFEEFGQREVKCICNRVEVAERGITFAAFNASDVGAVQTRDFSKAFLGEACRFTQLSNPGTDGQRNPITHSLQQNLSDDYTSTDYE
jgi:hypothetical protein